MASFQWPVFGEYLKSGSETGQVEVDTGDAGRLIFLDFFSDNLCHQWCDVLPVLHLVTGFRCTGAAHQEDRAIRRRERLVREIYDKACEVAQDVISPHLKELDYVMLGGERHTVNSFVKRCRFLQDLSYKTLNRRVAVDQPNHKALESIHREVWKSRVVTFE